MRKLPLILILGIVIVAAISGCSKGDNNWDDYAEWRNANNSWLDEKKKLTNPDGTPYYTELRPGYDKGQYALAHWFNDRSATAGNLTPYWTSTVDVKYIGHFYNDVPFDSSYLMKESYGDSIFRTGLSGVISGWGIVLQEMHVGDSVEVLIPYQSGYGATGYGSVPPYSNLRFNIKLTNIPYWETKQ